jgi:adenosine deaminase
MRAAHDLSDADLARLARMSVTASCAPEEEKRRIHAGIDAWLADDPVRAGSRPAPAR